MDKFYQIHELDKMKILEKTLFLKNKDFFELEKYINLKTNKIINSNFNLEEYEKVANKFFNKKIGSNKIKLFILGQTVKQFEKFIKDKTVKNLILNYDIKRIESIFGNKKIIKTTKDFHKLKEKLDTYFFINIDFYIDYSKINIKNFLKILNILDYLLNYNNIDLINNIFKLNNNNLLIILNRFRHINQSKFNNHREKEILNILKLKQNKNNTYDIKVKDKYAKIGACNTNESDNYDILKNKLYDKVKFIYIGNKIIGYIKKINSNSFLAFEDVFDKNGNLIFVKGWIYSIGYKEKSFEKNFKLNNNQKIDILKVKNFERNPIRKIKKHHNKNLYDNFDKLLYEFILMYNNN